MSDVFELYRGKTILQTFISNILGNIFQRSSTSVLTSDVPENLLVTNCIDHEEIACSEPADQLFDPLRAGDPFADFNLSDWPPQLCGGLFSIVNFCSAVENAQIKCIESQLKLCLLASPCLPRESAIHAECCTLARCCI